MILFRNTDQVSGRAVTSGGDVPLHNTSPPQLVASALVFWGLVCLSEPIEGTWIGVQWNEDKIDFFHTINA